ncbi:MAG: oligosaccharide flippase family protein [Candidatus Gottesmanbacteria bacterium]
MKIKGLIKKITSHALARDSAIMFAGSMSANVASYIYHLLMGRLLGPNGYGELSSLLSIFYIFSVPLNVGALVLVKFISGFKAKGEVGQAKSLFLRVTKSSVILCIVLLPIIVLVSPVITAYLHIQSSVMFIIVYLIFVFSLLGVIMGSVLQGYQKFMWVSVLGAGSIILKLLLSIPAVQFNVMGVLMATLVSGVIMYLLYFWPLRFLFRFPSLPIKLTKREAFGFAVPTLFITLGMTSIYSTDMILVRHYFQSVDAGIYASLAVLGKIIFYASSVLATVFYPVLSERTAKGEKTSNLVGIGLMSVTVISSAITLFYFLFPDFIIKMLFGSLYVGGAPLLGIFGIFLVLYSIGNMFTVTFLATGKTKIWIIPVVCALLQIIGISFIHQNILQVIYINIGISTLLVIGLGVYYLHNKAITA